MRLHLSPLLALALCLGACGDDSGSGGHGGAGGAVVFPPVCSMPPADLKEGLIEGLSTKDVPLLPPVVTPQPSVTPPDEHFQKQVGVLNLSPTIQDAQAIEHLLRPMGIPYAITMSPKLSLAHDLVIFFPEAYPANFDADELHSVQLFLDKGGVLIQRFNTVPELEAMAGLTGARFQERHTTIRLTEAGKAEFPSLDHPAEQEISLGGSEAAFINTWALELDETATNVTVLAQFEDGSPAIVKRTHAGGGVVYTLGIDYRDTVIRNQLGYAINAARSYINVFEPGTDTWLLMIRDLYDAHVRFGVRLHTAPSGHRAIVLFTHDLDWGPSYDNSLVYVEEEKRFGVVGTYFLHTKYVTDAQDTAFFFPERACQATRFLEYGATVGSHSVSHSKVLDTFPFGDINDVYPAYRPRNVTKTETEGGSLLGELRASKALIDGGLAAAGVTHETRAFRAGELSYNVRSPEALERTGYRYDSTRPIGESLSNFPYRAMTDWPEALDTSIFEFSIQIDDELPPKLDERVDQAVEIITANANNGAPTTVLIHPNVTDYKLHAQQEMMARLPEGVAGLSLETFGDFWRARDVAKLRRIDFNEVTRELAIRIETDEPLRGLTLRVATGVEGVKSPEGARFIEGPVPGSNFVVLPDIKGAETVDVVLTYDPAKVP